MRGIADFEKGGNPNFETATESTLAAQSVGVRRGDRRGQAEDFMKRCIKKLAQVRQQTLEEVEVSLSDTQFENVRPRNP